MERGEERMEVEGRRKTEAGVMGLAEVRFKNTDGGWVNRGRRMLKENGWEARWMTWVTDEG